MSTENGSSSSPVHDRCYTPGPWTNVGTSKRDFGTVTHVGPAEHPSGICEVYGSTDEEPKANIALIASAPDLLRACEMLLEWHEYGGDAVQMLDDSVWEARKAVLRARGV